MRNVSSLSASAHKFGRTRLKDIYSSRKYKEQAEAALTTLAFSLLNSKCLNFARKSHFTRFLYDRNSLKRGK